MRKLFRVFRTLRCSPVLKVQISQPRSLREWLTWIRTAGWIELDLNSGFFWTQRICSNFFAGRQENNDSLHPQHLCRACEQRSHLSPAHLSLGLSAEFDIRNRGSHLTLTSLYLWPYHTRTRTHINTLVPSLSCIRTPLHLSTFLPPSQPPVSCLQYCAPRSLLALHAHAHTRTREVGRRPPTAVRLQGG